MQVGAALLVAIVITSILRWKVMPYFNLIPGEDAGILFNLFAISAVLMTFFSSFLFILNIYDRLF